MIHIKSDILTHEESNFEKEAGVDIKASNKTRANEQAY